MKKIIIFSIIGVLILAGVIIADTIIFDNAGNPIYEYNFILSNDVKCDLHWLRPRIQYDMGMFPTYISYIQPTMDIGFPVQLDKTQLAQLTDILNRTEETCSRPKGIGVEYIININPDEFTRQFTSTIAGAKPFYYSDGVNVSLFILKELTPADKTTLQNTLCSMWMVK